MKLELTKMESKLPDGRFNGRICLAVNKGITEAMLSGLVVGEKVMHEAGIPKAIIERVLKCKTLRRASDWQ